MTILASLPPKYRWDVSFDATTHRLNVVSWSAYLCNISFKLPSFMEEHETTMPSTKVLVHHPKYSYIIQSIRLFNIHLLDLHILSIEFGDSNDKNTILHLGGNAIGIHLRWTGPASQPDLSLEDTHLSLGHSKCLQKVLIARSVDHPSNAQFALIGIPVDADIFFLRSCKRNVDHVSILRIEDVGGRSEVFATVFVIFVFFSSLWVDTELLLEELCDRGQIERLGSTKGESTPAAVTTPGPTSRTCTMMTEAAARAAMTTEWVG